MKKILSILLALALMLGAAALAEGNVTIAVQGMNDFNDYIQSMIVYGDKLLLSSWDALYTWDNATRKLTEAEGYNELESTLIGDDENPGRWHWFEGNFDDYQKDRERRLGAEAAKPHRLHRKLTRD